MPARAQVLDLGRLVEEERMLEAEAFPKYSAEGVAMQENIVPPTVRLVANLERAVIPSRSPFRTERMATGLAEGPGFLSGRSRLLACGSESE